MKQPLGETGRLFLYLRIQHRDTKISRVAVGVRRCDESRRGKGGGSLTRRAGSGGDDGEGEGGVDVGFAMEQDGRADHRAGEREGWVGGSGGPGEDGGHQGGGVGGGAGVEVQGEVGGGRGVDVGGVGGGDGQAGDGGASAQGAGVVSTVCRAGMAVWREVARAVRVISFQLSVWGALGVSTQARRARRRAGCGL